MKFSILWLNNQMPIEIYKCQGMCIDRLINSLLNFVVEHMAQTFVFKYHNLRAIQFRPITNISATNYFRDKKKRCFIQNKKKCFLIFICAIKIDQNQITTIKKIIYYLTHDDRLLTCVTCIIPPPPLPSSPSYFSFSCSDSQNFIISQSPYNLPFTKCNAEQRWSEHNTGHLLCNI